MEGLKRHIVSFSGGKDSTAMLFKMIENNMKIDDVLFCDTGVEFPDMYDHIKQVEKYIGNKLTVIKNEYSYEYYMFDYIKVKGKNKGKRGYSWSDFRNRWCTRCLKITPISKYLRQYKGYDIIEYHGIALDEIHRTEKNKGRDINYPLVEWGMTEKDCLEYCYSKGFTWNGLYEKFDRVSCFLCPLQRLRELKVIYREFPDLWAYMRELDRRSVEQFNRKFRSDYSIAELEVKFDKEDMTIV